MSSPKLAIGRFSEVGAFYAITTTTAERRPVLVADAAIAAATAMRDVERGGRVENVAWAIMPDHIHWLLQLTTSTLSAAVGQMKSQVTRTMRLPAGPSTSLWQAGYYDHRIRVEEDLAFQARYIIHNPVRKGWVSVPSEFPHVWCRYGLDLGL